MNILPLAMGNSSADKAFAILLLTNRMMLSCEAPKLRKLMLPYHTIRPSITAYFWWVSD